MPFANATRVAHPPGGRSNFSFNDGSDKRVTHSRPLGEAGAGYFRPSSLVSKPPGGASSIVFDDHISRVKDISEQTRHTNGLRMILRPEHQDSADPVRQPPGGRSSFAFADNMSSRAPSSHDCLDAFMHAPAPYAHQPSDSVRSHGPGTVAPSPPFVHPNSLGNGGSGTALGHLERGISGSRRQQLAPPGGASSFSIGWGQEAGNHHMAYLGRKTAGEHAGVSFGRPNEDPARNGGEDYLSSRNITPSSFSQAFAAGKPRNDFAKHQSQPMVGMSGLADYTANVRTEVHCAQPPGGRSSFVFG